MPLSNILVSSRRNQHSRPKVTKPMNSRYPGHPRFPLKRPYRGGRNQIEAFDSYAGLDFFSDLAIDPLLRARMESGLGDEFGFSYDRGFDQRQDSERRRNHDERQRPARPERGLPSGKVLLRSGMNPLPFGRAMKDLHKALGRAEELYYRFMSDYDNDTLSAKRYAPAETLHSMWRAKVKGMRDPQTWAEGEDRTGEEGAEKFERKFAQMEEKIMKALEVAASSTLYQGPPSELHSPSAKTTARLDSSKRLQKKCHLAMEELFDLMEKAKETRENCRHLVSELQQWQSLVSPDLDMNRELFRSGDDDEDLAADEQTEADVWNE